MPKALNTLCHASRTQAKSARRCSHVWISDDILSETFRAFANNHRRHGSNVPGPLEARRRAAKRKATSLAHHSHGVANNDPLGLMGSQSQLGWWQPTETSPTPTSQSWMWPLGLPHRPPPPPEPTTSEILLGRELEGIAQLPESIETRLQKQLEKISTHEDMLQVLDELSINLTQSPQLAQRALAHILSQNWDLEEVAKFLLDPKVNPVGSCNHAFLFKTHEYHNTVLKSMLERGTITRATQLGLLSVTDLKTIFRKSMHLQASIYGDHLDSSSFCNSLLDAMESSGVLSLRDFGARFVDELLLLIKQNDFYHSTPRLLWRLRQVRSSSDDTLLSQVITESIDMNKKSTIVRLRGLVDFLSGMPQSCVNSAIFNTTLGLVSLAGPLDQRSSSADFGKSNSALMKLLVAELSTPAAEGQPCEYSSFSGTEQIAADKKTSFVAEEREAKQLELWYAVLAALGSQQGRPFKLCMTTFNKFIEPCSQDKHTHQKLLIGLWVAMALSVRDASSLEYFNLSEDTSRMLRIESEIREEDVLAIILDALKDSPLPAKNKLLQRMRAFSKGHLNAKVSYWDLCAQLVELRSADVGELRNERFYQSARHHFPIIVSKLSESLNHDSALFETLCCDIIRDTKGCVNLVQRLLFHNNELKFALRYASSKLYWDGSQWQVRAEQASSQEALGGYTYIQLIEMIDNIAWECATAQHLSDRSAFRYTHWLCMYLHMHRAPVTPRMLRALWHAGITRNENHCYKVVGEIYSLVVEYEGHAAAQKLLNQAAKQRPALRNHVKATFQRGKSPKAMPEPPGADDVEGCLTNAYNPKNEGTIWPEHRIRN